jgi:hypothetical protein
MSKPVLDLSQHADEAFYAFIPTTLTLGIFSATIESAISASV